MPERSQEILYDVAFVKLREKERERETEGGRKEEEEEEEKKKKSFSCFSDSFVVPSHLATSSCLTSGTI